MVLAVGFTSCYDEMDDKAVVDAKYELANVPTVTLSATNVIDYSSASVTASLSSAEGVAEVGFMVADNADFSGAKIYIASAVSSSIEQALAGLAEQTTYNVKAYAYLGDGRMVYSDASSFTTPQAPPLSTEMLSGKTYTATVTSYFGNKYSFDVTLVADAADPTKIYVQNLDPYFASYGYTAAKGYNSFVGVLDSEAETITVAQGQAVGYGDVALGVFDNADPDAATGYSDLVIKVISKGAALKIENAFGVVASDGWWELYYGGFTLDVK